MRKRNEGYALAYVVVVLFVLASVALATMGLALTPAKNQETSLRHMQDKYTAQGMVEQVVAVLERTTDDITNPLSEELLTKIIDRESITITLDTADPNHITVTTTVNNTSVTAELMLTQITKTEVTEELDENGEPISITTPVGYTVKYHSYKTEVLP